MYFLLQLSVTVEASWTPPLTLVFPASRPAIHTKLMKLFGIFFFLDLIHLEASWTPPLILAFLKRPWSRLRFTKLFQIEFYLFVIGSLMRLEASWTPPLTLAFLKRP